MRSPLKFYIDREVKNQMKDEKAFKKSKNKYTKVLTVTEVVRQAKWGRMSWHEYIFSYLAALNLFLHEALFNVSFEIKNMVVI